MNEVSAGEQVEVRVRGRDRPFYVSGQVIHHGSTGLTLIGGVSGQVRMVAADDILEVKSLGSSPLGDALVRTYRGRTPEQAVLAMQSEVGHLRSAGFEPKEQIWAQGQWGAGMFVLAVVLAVVLIGLVVLLFLIVVKPEGSLTVTYRRVADDDTRPCPRCAEKIKDAAKICRYCNLELAPTVESQVSGG